jgi:hypothetical protein
MKTPKTSSSRRSVVVIVALLTALVMAVVVPTSVVKPVYAQIVDVDEQIAEEFIPEFDLRGELGEEMLPPLTFGEVLEEEITDTEEEIEEEIIESDIELLPGL